MTLADHVTITELEHGAVLLDQRTGRYWQINKTAHAILTQLRHTGTVDTAIEELRRRFPDEADQVAADAEQFVRTLRKAKLVTA